MDPLTAYLDTCIISGLARRDLSAQELAALERILAAHKRGEVSLVTSQIAKTEIERVPQAHRSPHEVIYYLLADVPAARFWRTDPGLMLMNVGGGRRQDRLFISLSRLLPDAEDAMHVFQAAKNGVGFLITTDHRTLIRFSGDIERLCGVRVLCPMAFEQHMAQATPKKGADDP
jgi:hypothetical protein